MVNDQSHWELDGRFNHSIAAIIDMSEENKIF
jgi:hypothetical protein